MIALIIYKSHFERPSFSLDIITQFQCWHEFYKISGTTMPFRIFTDAIDSVDIPQFETTIIHNTPPCSKNTLCYGDWLRSELFSIIQSPLIYMDLDCLILKPVDERYFDFDKPIALTQAFDGSYNCGLIVQKENIKDIYQNQFVNNPNKYDKYQLTYGQLIWSDINKDIGHKLPIEYHTLVSHMYRGYMSDKIRILHCFNDSITRTLGMASLFSDEHKEVYKNLNLNKYSLPNFPVV